MLHSFGLFEIVLQQEKKWQNETIWEVVNGSFGVSIFCKAANDLEVLILPFVFMNEAFLSLDNEFNNATFKFPRKS